MLYTLNFAVVRMVAQKRDWRAERKEERKKRENKKTSGFSNVIGCGKLVRYLGLSFIARYFLRISRIFSAPISSDILDISCDKPPDMIIADIFGYKNLAISPDIWGKNQVSVVYRYLINMAAAIDIALFARKINQRTEPVGTCRQSKD